MTQSNQTATNASFYTECLDHLCRLDQCLERIKKPELAGSPVERIAGLRAMLVEVVNFIEPRMKPAAFKQMVARVTELNDEARQVSAGLSSSLDGSQRTTRVIQQYNLLRQDITEFVVNHLNTCSLGFDVSEVDKLAYEESVDAFAQELGRIW